MEPGALEPYEHALITGAALALYHDETRSTTLLDVERWRRAADATDHAMLAHAVGPALDIGCGPGRITAALSELGVFTIGIDISAVAVAMAQARGVTALRRDVFRTLPGEGRWNTVVLLDGNIGIGGRPEVLLRRIHQLLAPGGVALIETHPNQRADERLTVRFTREDDPVGAPFPWALVGRLVLCDLARRADFTVAETWMANGRSFTVLRRPRRSRPTSRAAGPAGS
jgi:SAM-dependent methyltransferase